MNNNLQKIDELKEPPIVGEYYLVPCIISKIKKLPDRRPEDFYDDPDIRPKKIALVYPIINHLHDDKETGQEYLHYHTDYRFVDVNYHKRGEGFEFIEPAKRDKRYEFAPNARFNLFHDYFFAETGVSDAFGWNFKPTIEYINLRCYRLTNLGVAGEVKIESLHHKCIHRGKCAHTGYDLSQEVPVDGKIICPLHGLTYDAITKQLIIE